MEITVHNQFIESLVRGIIENPFCRRSYEDRAQIISNCRPTPLLTLRTEAKKNGKPFIRHFQESMYNTYPWLCGSSELSKLFCWPCLLFPNEKSTWNTSGYSDLNNFTTAVKRHEKSRCHISSSFQWNSFGKVRIDLELDEQRRRALSTHNENAKTKTKPMI